MYIDERRETQQREEEEGVGEGREGGNPSLAGSWNEGLS